MSTAEASMTKAKNKSWREKLEKEAPGYPKIVDVPERWARSIGHGKMVILTPKIIDRFIRTIPKGKLATINLLREKFAIEYKVDTTCPLTTGIFVWISAGAAEEDKAEGKKQITPYWRVLKEGGKLNPKFPGGILQHAKYLTDEGFQILKGKSDTSRSVNNYKQYLIKI
jgi:hypothetical protein